MERAPNGEENSSQRPSPPPRSAEEQVRVRSTPSEQPNSVDEQASARPTPPQILGPKSVQIQPLKVGTLPKTLPDIILFSMTLSINLLPIIQISMRMQNNMNERIHLTASELGIQRIEKKSWFFFRYHDLHEYLRSI